MTQTRLVLLTPALHDGVYCTTVSWQMIGVLQAPIDIQLNAYLGRFQSPRQRRDRKREREMNEGLQVDRESA